MPVSFSRDCHTGAYPRYPTLRTRRCKPRDGSRPTSAGVTPTSSNIPEVAVPALAASKARGAGDAFLLDDVRARRPLAFQALAHRLAPGAQRRQAIGAHAFLREAGDLFGHGF